MRISGRRDGGRGREGSLRSGTEVLVCRQKQLQRPGDAGRMDPEAARVGAPREPGLRGGLAEGRARRRGRGGAPGDRQTHVCRQRRYPENESAQVRQSRGHGRAHLPQRGLRPPQPQGPVLLRPHLRKSHLSTQLSGNSH